MDVSIIGAGGDCGRQIAVQLITSRVLSPTDRLQLVGRADGPSARTLHGFCSDLSDAYAEIAPELDVALRPEDVVGDVIVMTGGASTPIDTRLASDARDSLGRHNAGVFETYARALVEHGDGNEVVIVVSNPVELGVEVFSRRLGRKRVIGIGAYQDTLRFRREIAADLGVRRQRVAGFVLGEHGELMVPLWSSVRVHSLDTGELAAATDRMRRGRRIGDFTAEVRRERSAVMALVTAGRVAEALAHVDRLPPDLRVALKPHVTHFSGAKTAVATANVAVDLVETLMDGREIIVAGQVRLDGEFCGLHGPVGAPIVVGGGKGWATVLPLQLWEDEARLLTSVADTINAKIRGWLS